MSFEASLTLWKADRDPEQNGRSSPGGRVHLVAYSRTEDARTLCGRFLFALPGKDAVGRPNCRTCINSRAKWLNEREGQKTYVRLLAEEEAERAEEKARRDAEYENYRRTYFWRERRAEVMKRADGWCEACRKAPATEVHHTTYAHIFREPLFELRAVCGPCHDSITEMDKAAEATRKAAQR